jgi:polysaccharide export outer membrane protein
MVGWYQKLSRLLANQVGRDLMGRPNVHFSKGLVLTLFLACCLLSGCATGSGQNPTAQAQQPLVEQQATAGADYKIAPGDVLNITVHGEEGLKNQELVVRPDGKVTFPLAGDLEVGGLSTAQAKEILENKLHEFIPEAVAVVGVQQLGSLQYYVVGKVNKPGMFNVSKPVTVLQALALAGGLTIFADEKNIQIVRNTDRKVANLIFNYKEVKHGRHLEQNIVLERGDTVVVP